MNAIEAVALRNGLFARLPKNTIPKFLAMLVLGLTFYATSEQSSHMTY